MGEDLESTILNVRGSQNNENDLIFLEFSKTRLSEINQSLNDIDKKEFTSLIDHPLKVEAVVYHAFYLGYFSVDDVKGYFCSKCDRGYDEKPLQEVFIELPREEDKDRIGRFYLKCNHCDNYVLFDGIVKEGENVDVKYIVQDNRGLFIPKTEKDVNKKLKKHLEEAKKGLTMINTEIVEYWAKNLNLDISKRLEEIKEIGEGSYFKNYQERLPEIIEELEKHSDFVGYSHHLLRSEEDNMGYEEGSDFYEIWTEFVKYLPKLTFTPELKEKILDIFNTIKGNTKRCKQELEKKLEEKKKEFFEAIADSEKEINELRGLEDLVKQK